MDVGSVASSLVPSTQNENVSIVNNSGGNSGASESPLPPAILRSLGDRSYDKRKNAALEIEALIKSLQENTDTDRICSVIAMLGQDFATSTNANHRKGGLIGLAATAIGLMSDISLYLDALLPPVLHCLDDPESRVRYYSCESLYNIAKVARGNILKYFNHIFDGLCKLFADVDIDVKNGASLLDRLIKDIVTESDTFDVERFIPLLQKYMRRSNPYIRQLLIGWIIVLDSVPDINMLDWLPDFLDGLFNMLSDTNREIRQAAGSAIGNFLNEIKKNATTPALIKISTNSTTTSPSSTTPTVAANNTSSQIPSTTSITSCDKKENENNTAPEIIEFGPMVNILVNQCKNKERLNRITAITWVQDFIKLGKNKLLYFYSELLGAIMYCISDEDLEISQVAESTNTNLLNLVKCTNDEFELSPLLQTLTHELSSHHIPTRLAALRWINMLLEKVQSEMNKYIYELLPALLRTLSDDADEVILLNLEVLARIALLDKNQFQRVLFSIVSLFASNRHLLEVRGSLIIRNLCTLLNAKSIYNALASILGSDENKNIQDSANLDFGTANINHTTCTEKKDVEDKIMTETDTINNERELISTEKILPETCSSDTNTSRVNQTATSPPSSISNNEQNNDTDPRIFLATNTSTTAAKGNSTINDLEFRSIMVQTLNLILLTARELDELRNLLLVSLEPNASIEARALFITMFKCWCHNPVATLSLCFAAQAYELASELVMQFASIDVTVGFLMQVDKLVQLVESPIFIQLRLQLLQVHAPFHPPLLKSLYGLLMLLPQSAAFSTLSTRLATVATLRDNLHLPPPLPPTTKINNEEKLQSNSSEVPTASTNLIKSSQATNNEYNTSVNAIGTKHVPNMTELLQVFQAVQLRHKNAHQKTILDCSLINNSNINNIAPISSIISSST